MVASWCSGPVRPPNDGRPGQRLSLVLEAFSAGRGILTLGFAFGNVGGIAYMLDHAPPGTITEAQLREATVFALAEGHVDVLRLLLRRGHDLAYRDAAGLTLADHAIEFGQLEIANMLRDEANVTPAGYS